MAQALPAEDLCHNAVAKAARAEGLPQTILQALALTESGRQMADGRTTAWPWVLNIAGEGRFFATETQARAALQSALATGERSIDIGCLQLNFRWHGEAFAEPEDMLDPLRNASYAAAFLSQLLRRHAGDWQAAIAAYHSADPLKAEAYWQRLRPILADLAEQAPAVNTPARVNGFPLLQPLSMGMLGSLVPMSPAGPALWDLR